MSTLTGPLVSLIFTETHTILQVWGRLVLIWSPKTNENMPDTCCSFFALFVLGDLSRMLQS